MYSSIWHSSSAVVFTIHVPASTFQAKARRWYTLGPVCDRGLGYVESSYYTPNTVIKRVERIYCVTLIFVARKCPKAAAAEYRYGIALSSSTFIAKL
jgi:hypothetical protein